MNNRMKAERACRRFAKAHNRQTYVTPHKGDGNYEVEIVGGIDLEVVAIETTGALEQVRVRAVVHDVNITVWSDSELADAVASQAAELVIRSGREAVTLEDLEDTCVIVPLTEADANILGTYIAYSLDLFADGRLTFRVDVEPTDAAVLAPVVLDDDFKPTVDEGNVLPLAQAKFEAMVAA